MCEHCAVRFLSQNKELFQLLILCTSPAIIAAHFHWINTVFVTGLVHDSTHDACVIIYSKLWSPIYCAHCKLWIWQHVTVRAVCCSLCKLHAKHCLFDTVQCTWNSVEQRAHCRADKEAGRHWFSMSGPRAGAQVPRLAGGGKFHVGLKTILTARITMSTTVGG